MDPTEVLKTETVEDIAKIASTDAEPSVVKTPTPVEETKVTVDTNTTTTSEESKTSTPADSDTKVIPTIAKPKIQKPTVRKQKVILKDNIKGISNNEIRRTARRGGVKRLSKAIYDEARTCTKEFLTKNIRVATNYTEHARRSTVMVQDVVSALKFNKTPIYGY